MANEKTPKNQPNAIVETIDPEIHRRVLAFLNAARSPEDLLVAPNESPLLHALDLTRGGVPSEGKFICFEEHVEEN